MYRLAPDGSIELVVPRRRGVEGSHARRGGLVISGRNVCHGATARRVFSSSGPTSRFNDLFADAAGAFTPGSMRDDPSAGGRADCGGGLPHQRRGRRTELYAGVGSRTESGYRPTAALYTSTAPSRARPPIDESGDVDGKHGEVFARVKPGVPTVSSSTKTECVGGGVRRRLRHALHRHRQLERQLPVPASSRDEPSLPDRTAVTSSSSRPTTPNIRIGAGPSSESRRRSRGHRTRRDSGARIGHRDEGSPL